MATSRYLKSFLQNIACIEKAIYEVRTKDRWPVMQGSLLESSSFVAKPHICVLYIYIYIFGVFIMVFIRGVSVCVIWWRTSQLFANEFELTSFVCSCSLNFSFSDIKSSTYTLNVNRLLRHGTFLFSFFFFNAHINTNFKDVQNTRLIPVIAYETYA